MNRGIYIVLLCMTSFAGAAELSKKPKALAKRRPPQREVAYHLPYYFESLGTPQALQANLAGYRNNKNFLATAHDWIQQGEIKKCDRIKNMCCLAGLTLSTTCNAYALSTEDCGMSLSCCCISLGGLFFFWSEYDFRLQEQQKIDILNNAVEWTD